jgi:hypothetical protein
MADWALFYRGLGLPVFPVCPALVSHTHRERTRDGDRVIWQRVTCTKMGKTPLVAWAEYQAAVPAAAEVEAWWARFPGANIGLATGELSGVVVVDLDGDLAVRTAVDLGGMPSGPHSFTGRVGGQHRFFKWRPEAPTLFSKRSGIDFRGQGGYVVLPPSLHVSRTAYRWGWPLDDESLADLPELPDWVITLGQEREVAVARSAGQGTFGWRPMTDIPEGTRDNTLMSIAGRLRGEDGLEEYEIGVRLEAINLEFCKPPVTLADVLRLAHSAAKYAINPPDEKLSGRLDGDTFPVSGAETLRESSPGKVSEDSLGLETMTLADWRDKPQQAVEWVCEGLIGKGMVTELTAYPKVGKTVLAMLLVRAMLRGETSFCGLALTPGRVLYLTEEGDTTFREELETWALLDIPDGLWTTTQIMLGNRRWGMTCSDAILTARTEDISLVIVDTITELSGIEDEDNSIKVRAITNQLRRVANAGFAVLYLRHARKSGGPVGQSGRGSSAFAGAADILLDLTYPNGDTEGEGPARDLRGKGRMRQIPGRLTLILEEGEYHVRPGDSPPVKLKPADGRPLWEVLAEDLFQRNCRNAASGLSVDDLAIHLKRDPKAIRVEAETRVRLGQLVEGRFQRAVGRKPARVFWLPSGLATFPNQAEIEPDLSGGSPLPPEGEGLPGKVEASEDQTKMELE